MSDYDAMQAIRTLENYAQIVEEKDPLGVRGERTGPRIVSRKARQDRQGEPEIRDQRSELRRQQNESDHRSLSC